MSEFLSKAAILEAADHEYETLEVPKWGGKVRIRTLTVGERDRWEAQALRLHRSDGTERVHLRTLLVAMSIVDVNGDAVFGTTEAELRALGDKDSATLEAVFDACLKLSRLTAEAKEAAAKNSETTLSESSALA